MKNGIALVLVLVLLVCVGTWFDSTETRYAIDAQVTYANPALGIVEVTDVRGEAWEFLDEAKYAVGEIITLYMDTNGTKTIYDDEITGVKRK